jgi:hypothetical protein
MEATMWVSYYPTSYIGHPLYCLINNKTFSLAIPLNLDILPAISYNNYSIKSKLFLILFREIREL